MTDTKALALLDEIQSLGPKDLTDERRVALGGQLQMLLPSQFKTPQAALAYTMYTLSMGLNPFRDDTYGWEGKDGELIVMDSYKATIRWAQEIGPFTAFADKVDPTEEGAPADALVYRAFVLRDSQQGLLERRAEMFGKERALKMTATTAVGVVTWKEMHYEKDYHGNPVPKARQKETPPPKGWTWKQVCEKRAIRNAVRLSHGQPSAGELRDRAWFVKSAETIPADWLDARPGAPMVEREQHAMLNAEGRASRARVAEMTPEQRTALIEDTNGLLYGTDEDAIEAEIIRRNGPASDDGPTWFYDLPAWAKEIETPRGTHYINLTAEQLMTVWDAAGDENTKEARAARLYLAGKIQDWTRPYGPHALRALLNVRSGRGVASSDPEASKAQRGLVAAKLNEAFNAASDPDAWRHSFLKFAFGGEGSTSNLTMGQASAVIDWLCLPKDSTGDHPLVRESVDEANRVVRLVCEDAGQTDMFAPDLPPDEDEVEPDGYYDDEDSIPF